MTQGVTDVSISQIIICSYTYSGAAGDDVVQICSSFVPINVTSIVNKKLLVLSVVT